MRYTLSQLKEKFPGDWTVCQECSGSRNSTSDIDQRRHYTIKFKDDEIIYGEGGIDIFYITDGDGVIINIEECEVVKKIKMLGVLKNFK